MGWGLGRRTAHHHAGHCRDHRRATRGALLEAILLTLPECGSTRAAAGRGGPANFGAEILRVLFNMTQGGRVAGRPLPMLPFCDRLLGPDVRHEHSESVDLSENVSRTGASSSRTLR